MPQRCAIAVIGVDRPGIVAQVSAPLLSLGANLEDVSTSILRGHFALMLVVALADGSDRLAVENALQPLRGEALAIDVWDVHGPLASAQATHVLTVYGPDSTGIVHTVSQALADLQVNICDMVCRLHEGSSPIYVVTVEVAVPDHLDPARLEHSVSAAVQPRNLEVSLRSVERSDL